MPASGIGGVEQSRQQSSEFLVSALAQDFGHLFLDALDGLKPGRYGVSASLGDDDEFRPAVVGVGTTDDVPQMTPALMGPFVLARLAIAVWTLLFAALGYALWKADER